METIEIKEKKFSLFLNEFEIQLAISKMAIKMNQELADKNPLFICVLNGAFMFASDLLKKIQIQCEICFVRYASYNGLETSGTVKELMGINTDISGRNVVVLEDIVDTGITMTHLLSLLKNKSIAEIKVASLLLKPEALQCQVQIDYVGIEIPNNFIVGYGLDYDGYGGNFKDIYTIVG
jgi:hypoxanthine phosphoribosyltransferase